MIVTVDGLYYSQYIKHSRGGRGEWIGEFCGVRWRCVRCSTVLTISQVTRDIGVTLWYNRCITATGRVWFTRDESMRFWSWWMRVRSTFLTRRTSSYKGNLWLFHLHENDLEYRFRKDTFLSFLMIYCSYYERKYLSKHQLENKNKVFFFMYKYSRFLLFM